MGSTAHIGEGKRELAKRCAQTSTPGSQTYRFHRRRNRSSKRGRVIISVGSRRSLFGWFEVSEARLIDPELVPQTIEKAKVIQERLKMAQSRQESYIDVRRRALEFEVEDWLRMKEVASVKVFWRNQLFEKATWEAEEDMKKRNPYLFEFGGSVDQSTNFFLGVL
ncbi:hypothetical protein MTR67_017580 [Solanum verrucosum]|uniref:Uncharacterized protein n=1 Tax=Solanum verrucosum TaxID=315347 RepID=A0AAF0QN38_SOLVR|nr:hypothetical protein MTR67_017580 [Solanum verrucosum]